MNLLTDLPPVLARRAFKADYQLRDTLVADAGMISEANQVALQAAGLSYILGGPDPAAARCGWANGATGIPVRRSLTGWS